MDSDILGLLVASTVVLTALCVVGTLRIPIALKIILCIALALRFGGALGRYLVLTVAYNGVGDAMGYYREGLRWAERFWVGDFSPLYSPVWWRGGEWWGTQFVSFPSSLVTAVIGPNLLGSFIVFALFGLIGLLGFVVAYRHARPASSLTLYAALILFLPSLWYWPSSLGKESLALLGLGLTMMGLFGAGHRIRFMPLATGFFLLAAVRSELAGIVAVSVLVSQWLSFETRWTPAAAIRTVIVAGITLVVLRVASERVGIQSFDVEGITSYIEHDPARRLEGGSGIDALSVGLGGAVLAPINVLFRPFPWEASNAFALLSSLELVALWLLVLHRRRQFWNSLKRWREEPLLRLSVVFVILYAVGLGLMLSNLGVIARQRIFLFPFLFVLLQEWPLPTRRVRRSIPTRGVAQAIRKLTPAASGLP